MKQTNSNSKRCNCCKSTKDMRDKVNVPNWPNLSSEQRNYLMRGMAFNSWRCICEILRTLGVLIR